MRSVLAELLTFAGAACLPAPWLTPIWWTARASRPSADLGAPRWSSS